MLRLLLIFIVIWLAGVASLSAQETGRDLVRTRVIADHSQILPGGSFRVGIIFTMKPGWHIYWVHPGDAGMPTTITWETPVYTTFTSTMWPVPRRFTIPGDIVSYGYSEEVMLVVGFTAPADFRGDSLDLLAKVSWLACKEECVPGQTELEISIPVGKTVETAHAKEFEAWERTLHRPEAPPLKAHSWSLAGDTLKLSLEGVEVSAATSIEFYPIPPEDLVLGHARPLVLASSGDASLEIPVLLNEKGHNKVMGLLVFTDSGGAVVRRAWFLPE